jgi:hypothetical protein
MSAWALAVALDAGATAEVASNNNHRSTSTT